MSSTEIKLTPIWLILIVGASSLASLYLYSKHLERRESSANITVEYHTDTLSYSELAPISVEPFEGSDTLQLYKFEDSIDGRWQAEISGNYVELRSLVLREEYRSTTKEIYTPPKWEVQLLAGVGGGGSSWLGVGVERDFGAAKFSIGAGYDPLNRTPYAEGRIGFTLWREY